MSIIFIIIALLNRIYFLTLHYGIKTKKCKHILWISTSSGCLWNSTLVSSTCGIGGVVCELLKLQIYPPPPPRHEATLCISYLHLSKPTSNWVCINPTSHRVCIYPTSHWVCIYPTSHLVCIYPTSHWVCIYPTSHWVCMYPTSHWVCIYPTSHWVCIHPTSHWVCTYPTSNWVCIYQQKLH